MAALTLLVTGSTAAPARGVRPEAKFIGAPPSGVAAQHWIATVSPVTRIAASVAASEGVGAHVVRQFTHAIRGFAFTATPAQALAVAGGHDVLSIEADRPVHLTDTQEGAPWPIDRIDQRLQPYTGTYSYIGTGAGVTAYVVDTGIRATHTEFTGRVGAGFTAFNDGTGTNDCVGHGTHVAGILGGTTYGVAKKVTLVPVRVFNCSSQALESDVIAGLDWIVAQHVAGAPAVANMSLSGPPSVTLDAAVNRTIADGVSMSVAAGNDSADSCNYSPARVPAAITVGATDIYDSQASFSDFGPCLDLYAPGVAIQSAYNLSDTVTFTLSGTSMSSPFAAGVAATLLSTNPTWTPSQVSTAMTAAATPGLIANAGAGSPNRLLFNDPTVAFSGTVVDATGAGVPGVIVRVTRSSNNVDATTTTSSTGTYSTRIDTGPMTLTLSAAPTEPITLPDTWATGPVSFTSAADRVLSLALPPLATVAIQTYESTGAAVAGVVVHEVGTYTTAPYSMAAGLPLASVTTTFRSGTSDAQGRAVIHGFVGTAGAVQFDDTATGTLVRGTLTNWTLTDGLNIAVARGGTSVHTPTFVAAESSMTSMMRSILATSPDLTFVTINGAVGQTIHAFGCAIALPRDETEARNAVAGNPYIDTSGQTQLAPTGPCQLFTATVIGP
jgi:subtilisin family serine protease